jgi:hypothetical protein
LVARFNPRTGQKKVENISLFIIHTATPPDRSEPKISTDGACADFILFRTNPIRCLFSGVEISLYWKLLDRTGSEKNFHPVRSAAYFPEWKLAFTGNRLLDRTGSEKHPIRSRSDKPVWSAQTVKWLYRPCEPYGS